MKRIVIFLIGCAMLVALTWYAGAGAVAQAFVTLGAGGLLVVSLIHLPTVALAGIAWWAVGRDVPGAARWKFVAARLMRNAAGEVLPFSQLGGFAVGVRVLVLWGVKLFRGSLSLFADLVMEFAGKFPYAVIGIALVYAVQPRSGLLGPLALGAGLTAACVAPVVVFRGRLMDLLERYALKLVRRWTSLAPSADVRPAIAAVFAADRLAVCFAVHFVAWLMGAVETWAIFALMGSPVTLLETVVIDSLVGGLKTFVFLVPAAAGVQEGAYVLVCALFGMGPAPAVAFSLIRRAREFVLGVPALVIWQLMEARAPAAREALRETTP